MPNSLNSGNQGRGLPDVTGVADPNTGFAVLVDGLWYIVGGTSAVAPLFAGLAARVNATLNRPAGLINPFLYKAGMNSGFNDIVQGNNSADGAPGYSAAPGWDAASGWGSPNGVALLNLLTETNVQDAA